MINEKEIAAEIAKSQDALINKIESALNLSIGAMSPSESLTIRLMSNDCFMGEVKPEPSLRYAKALSAFMKGTPFESCDLDSSVTPIALSVCEQAIVEFYSSNEITTAISEAITRQLEEEAKTNQVLRQSISDNADWLKKEAVYTISNHTKTSIAVEATNLATDQITNFLHTTAGLHVMHAIHYALSTAAGKIALKEMIVIVVKKVSASAVLKTAIMTTLKKVSLAALMKTIIGKAMIAGMAAVGIAHVPAAWVILPVIGGFLIYEYKNFPSKLADKVPKEVGRMIRSRYTEINDGIIASIASNAFSSLIKEVTKPRSI